MATSDSIEVPARQIFEAPIIAKLAIKIEALIIREIDALSEEAQCMLSE